MPWKGAHSFKQTAFSWKDISHTEHYTKTQSSQDLLGTYQELSSGAGASLVGFSPSSTCWWCLSVSIWEWDFQCSAFKILFSVSGVLPRIRMCHGPSGPAAPVHDPLTSNTPATLSASLQQKWGMKWSQALPRNARSCWAFEVWKCCTTSPHALLFLSVARGARRSSFQKLLSSQFTQNSPEHTASSRDFPYKPSSLPLEISNSLKTDSNVSARLIVFDGLSECQLLKQKIARKARVSFFFFASFFWWENQST